MRVLFLVTFGLDCDFQNDKNVERSAQVGYQLRHTNNALSNRLLGIAGIWVVLPPPGSFTRYIIIVAADGCEDATVCRIPRRFHS